VVRVTTLKHSEPRKPNPSICRYNRVPERSVTTTKVESARNSGFLPGPPDGAYEADNTVTNGSKSYFGVRRGARRIPSSVGRC